MDESRKHHNQYTVSFRFLYDDEPDDGTFVISVPGTTTKEKMLELIRTAHEELDERKTDYDYYGNEGRDADTLLWYLKEKHGWSYEKFEPDASLVFE